MLKSFDYTLVDLVEERDNIFQISNYQRFFVWTPDKIMTFINDIESTIAYLVRDPSSVHYFGQMIVLETDQDRRGRITYEVIDGQQRLSSFLMLIAAIKGCALNLRNNFPELDSPAKDLERRCQNFLVSSKDGVPSKNKLTLAPQDNTYYQEILHHLSSYTMINEKKYPESNKNLYHAQLVIREELSRIIAHFDTPEKKLSKLIELVDVSSKKFQVIAIVPTKENYTYQLYQVVNDRGEPLKDSELLKAKSIEVLSENERLCEQAKEIWNDILSDSGKDTEKFLTWCYLSKVGSDKSEPRYYQAYLNNYFRIKNNSPLTEEEQETFFANLRVLHEDVQLCRKLSRGVWPFDNPTCPQWQQNVLPNLVIGMLHTLCIPVLISAFRQPPHHGVSTELNFYQTLELCETFFILIKGVHNMREDKFKSKYLSAAKQMRDTPLTYRATHFKAELNKIEPNLVKNNCLGQLQNLTYKPKASNPTLKYLLILLETYFPSFDEHNIPHSKKVPDGTNLVYSELSIEHIYAENALPDSINEDLEIVKHKLGNLLPYGKKANSRLKSKPYIQKISHYKASRFSTVTSVAESNNDWTIDNFNARHNDICIKLSNLLLRFYE